MGATTNPVLVTPHGFRIEGLDLAGLVTVLPTDRARTAASTSLRFSIVSSNPESLRCGAEGVSAACHARRARGPRRRHAAAHTPHLIDITAALRGDILRRSAAEHG